MDFLRLTVRACRSTQLMPRVIKGRPRASHIRFQRRAFAEQLNAHDPAEQKVEPSAVKHNNDQGPSNVRRVQSTRADPKLPYVEIPGRKPYHPVFLRDSCTCPKCVDPSSRQKNFQTTDIPSNIKAKSIEVLPEEKCVKIKWENDIPGFGAEHVSAFSDNFLNIHTNSFNLRQDRYETTKVRLWNKESITKELEYVDFEEYMKDDKVLFRATRLLVTHGLLLVRGVPESEKSVEDLAGRFGNIRDTFYGRTWDVKSVPQAKNVAYTHQFLGLHMDLLYMTNPPGFQFLHCLKNSCEGGNSLFADSFQAAYTISPHSRRTLSDPRNAIAYHYRNAGEHYYFQHPLIEWTEGTKDHENGTTKNAIKYINYSPPFQAPHISVGDDQQNYFPGFLKALRAFAEKVENEENLFEYRLKEGECVIFNNRRVLHGRRQFDAAVGERWLKGTYVDTDVVMSRWRVLAEKYRLMNVSVRAGDKDAKRANGPNQGPDADAAAT